MRDTTTAWMRSSYCNSGVCVEVARVDGTVQLRDSTNPDLPAVVFTPGERTGFKIAPCADGRSWAVGGPLQRAARAARVHKWPRNGHQMKEQHGHGNHPAWTWREESRSRAWRHQGGTQDGWGFRRRDHWHLDGFGLRGDSHISRNGGAGGVRRNHARCADCGRHLHHQERLIMVRAGFPVGPHQPSPRRNRDAVQVLGRRWSRSRRSIRGWGVERACAPNRRAQTAGDDTSGRHSVAPRRVAAAPTTDLRWSDRWPRNTDDRSS